MTDPTFLDWANEIKRLDTEFDKIPLDPQEGLEFCKREIEALGYTYLKKPKGILGEFEGFTTTFPLPRMPRNPKGVVWLPPGWDTFRVKAQMATMCHELVHARTETRESFHGTIGHYLSDEGRLSFELAPYWLSLRLKKRNGYSPERLRTSALRTVDALHKGYYLQGIPKNCLAEIALEYWEIPNESPKG